MPDSIPRCPRCGSARFEYDESVMCPACLLSTALSAADEDQNWEPGASSDRIPYQIITLIDRGARGATYLAHPIGTTRRVALKIAEGVNDAGEVIARFRKWKEALSYTRHEGLARLVDVGSAGDGRVYFASEYVTGAPLTSVLTRGALTPADRAAIAGQLVDAVEFAHAHGLAHMKLDAAHVKVANAGQVRAMILGMGIEMLLSGVPPRPEADVPPLLHIIRELGVDLNAPSFSTAAAIRHALSGNTPVR